MKAEEADAEPQWLQHTALYRRLHATVQAGKELAAVVRVLVGDGGVHDVAGLASGALTLA